MDATWIRRIAWALGSPLISIGLFFSFRFFTVLFELASTGSAETHLIEYRLSMYLLWPALGAALLVYGAAGIAWWLKKPRLFLWLDEVSSVGLAASAGLAMSVVHTRYSSWGPWLGLGTGLLIWLLILERHGKSPWRRMLRMAFFSAWFFAMIHAATHIDIPAFFSAR